MAGGAASAQDTSTEFWPELDAWLRVSPAWRFSLFAAITKRIESDYREGSLLPQVDYAWGKTRHAGRLRDEARARQISAFMVRGGYIAGWSLGENAGEYRERSMLGEFHVRIPLKGGFLVSNRLRADLRWLGENPEFSYRWRYRLMVEKEIAAGGSSVVPYVNAEAYYDSRFDTINRVRLIGGATIAWSSRVALEGNWTYQYDSRASVTNVNALNVIFHVFFEAGGSSKAAASPTRGPLN